MPGQPLRPKDRRASHEHSMADRKHHPPSLRENRAHNEESTNESTTRNKTNESCTMNKALGTIVAATLLTGSLCLVQAQESNPNAETRIRAAVAAGTMTPEEGRAKLQAMRKANAEAQPAANAETRIRAAVAAGTMTPEEGRAKLQAMRKANAEAQPAPIAEARIRAAVAAGTMTPEEGRAKLQATRKAMAAQAERQP